MSRKERGKFKVLFVAGFGPIVRDLAESHKFYLDVLGLPFQKDGDYLHTAKLEGVKHLALWPLSQAAQSCFGSENWPSDLPVPQAWLEFDVDDIRQATAELKKRGYTLLTNARKEPWGQAEREKQEFCIHVQLTPTEFMPIQNLINSVGKSWLAGWEQSQSKRLHDLLATVYWKHVNQFVFSPFDERDA